MEMFKIFKNDEIKKKKHGPNLTMTAIENLFSMFII